MILLRLEIFMVVNGENFSFMGLDAKYSATLKTEVESTSETMLDGVTLPIDSHLNNNVFFHTYIFSSVL
jgi:hypothetical protein